MSKKTYFFKVDLKTKRFKFLDSCRVGFSIIYNSAQKAKMVVVMAGKHACFTLDENYFLLNQNIYLKKKLKNSDAFLIRKIVCNFGNQNSMNFEAT